jgi:hypothetical protein
MLKPADSYELNRRRGKQTAAPGSNTLQCPLRRDIMFATRRFATSTILVLAISLLAGCGANTPRSYYKPSAEAKASAAPAATSTLFKQRVLAQQGLGVELAPSTFYTQVISAFLILMDPATGDFGSAPIFSVQAGDCNGSMFEQEANLPGSSEAWAPISESAPGAAILYYDDNCAQPWIEPIMTGWTAQIQQVGTSEATVAASTGESARFIGMDGSLLGTYAITEAAQADMEKSGLHGLVHGLGVFTPANGAPAVKLGLVCLGDITGNGVPGTATCTGAVAQDFPALNTAIGFTIPLSYDMPNGGDETSTFSSTGSSVFTGSLGSLSITAPTPQTLAIQGGSSYGTATVDGTLSSLLPTLGTPTAWTVTDSANDMKFQISVVDDTTRTLTGKISQISTGTVLATITVDRSGTGSITYSDASVASVTNWLVAE